MHRLESLQRYRFRYGRPPTGADPALTILLFLTSRTAFGLCAIMAAAALALIVVARPCTGASPSVATRDLAPAFAIVGCPATNLGEIEPLLEFIGQATSRNKADD